MSWVIVPAAGSGRRFGGDIPKQYLPLAGRPLIEHTLRALLACDGIDGAVVALAAGDTRWPGWRELEGKPVRACTGGDARADSVLAALAALPDDVAPDAFVLVHDAARPCVAPADIAALLAALRDEPVGALLAAPVRDTLKRAGDDHRSTGTEPRERLWRALTPQAFRRDELATVLRDAAGAGIIATDEAMAFERLGRRPRLVEGRDDNLKVTTPADLAVAETLVARRAATGAGA